MHIMLHMHDLHRMCHIADIVLLESCQTPGNLLMYALHSKITYKQFKLNLHGCVIHGKRIFLAHILQEVGNSHFDALKIKLPGEDLEVCNSTAPHVWR